MNKAFTRIHWENSPSTATPLNETNLNESDEALDVIDNRVIALDTNKANQSDLLTTVSDVSLNETTGVITVTWKNGTTRTYDTALEKVVTNFRYDSTTQSLILTYPDGTTEPISLAAFITQYEFTDTSTIDFTVAQDGTVSAIVKDGSITGDKLEPNYLANVTTQAANAAASATSAANSATSASTSATSASASADLAESYAVGTNGTVRTGDATDNAKYYSEQAASSATSAGTANTNAQQALTLVNQTKSAIDVIKGQIDTTATQVNSDASTASTAATNAANSATSAANSASSAATDAQRAEDAAEEAAAIVGIGVMTPTINGIGKPDDDTLQVDNTGTISVKKSYALNSALTSHTGAKVSDTNGVHGMKYNETSQMLQVQKQDGTWTDYEGGDSLGEQHTVTGNPLSFTTDSAQVSNKTIVSLEPIQAGSGDPSPSNVKPILGYDDIELYNKTITRNLALKPKNGVFAYNSGIYVDTDTYCYSDAFVESGKTYTISQGHELTDNARILRYDENGNMIAVAKLSQNPQIYTIPNDGTKMIRITNGGMATPVSKDTVGYIQVEEGSTATAFDGYGDILTIPAPDGTIYGGTLDVESGELVVDRAIYTITGEETFITWDSAYVTNSVLSPLCVDNGYTANVSKCEFGNPCPPNSINSGASGIGASKSKIYMDSTIHSNWSNLVGKKLVYELATPKTYRLSPHQVKLLQGANIVTTNGTSLSLTYRDGEVAGLSDLSGLAESVEGLSKPSKVNYTSYLTISLGDSHTFVRRNNMLTLCGNTHPLTTSQTSILSFSRDELPADIGNAIINCMPSNNVGAILGSPATSSDFNKHFWIGLHYDFSTHTFILSGWSSENMSYGTSYLFNFPIETKM